MARKIKKINLGGEDFEIHDAATAAAAKAAQEAADARVATINGYSYDDINSGKVLFAQTAIPLADLTALVDGIGKTTPEEDI